MIIQTLWDDAGQTMPAFLRLYQEMLQLYNQQVSFDNEETRKMTLQQNEETRKTTLHQNEETRKTTLHKDEETRNAALHEAELSRIKEEMRSVKM